MGEWEDRFESQLRDAKLRGSNRPSPQARRPGNSRRMVREWADDRSIIPAHLISERESDRPPMDIHQQEMNGLEEVSEMNE